jgi:hypothetical protein
MSINKKNQKMPNFLLKLLHIFEQKVIGKRHFVKQPNNRKKARVNNKLKSKQINNGNFLNNFHKVILNLWRKQKFFLLGIITLLLILEFQPIQGQTIIPQAQAVNIIKQEAIAPDRHIQFDLTHTSVILYS